MMNWYRCESIMPGERLDVNKNPKEGMAKFLVCYHKEEKKLVNPEREICMAYLHDGKFISLTNDSPYHLQEVTITHWMPIELP